MTPDEAWHEALADAGFEAADGLLLPSAGPESEGGDSGLTWARGQQVVESTHCRWIEEGGVARANSAAGLMSARVAVWPGHPVGIFAALVRHELEHSRQFDRWGAELQVLHIRSVEILIERAGGLPESNRLYNRIPMESDANAAASRFVRALFGAATVDRLLTTGTLYAALLRSQPPPEPIETMAARMREFVRHGAHREADRFLAAHDR